MRKSRFYRVDVPRRRSSLRSAVEYAVATFGGLDYAFNNAGIFASAPLADLEIEEWQRVVRRDLAPGGRHPGPGVVSGGPLP